MIDVVLALLIWAGLSGPAPLRTGEAAFFPEQRAVSNWRGQAVLHLETSFGSAVTLLLGRDPAAVTRCVRLNNYWCIKRAGWAGELAADADGHVAFASAAQGADVAAQLLRRYYVDYGRHSALAIVSHWAPASCGAGAGPAGRLAASADHLATHGLGRTLRARFLAAHGHRVAGLGKLRLHRSVIADRLLGEHIEGTGLQAPAIAVGLADADFASLSPFPPARLRRSGVATGAGTEPGIRTACSSDDLRIRAYAGKAAAGVAASPSDDLKLFDAAGRPTVNLARVMHNMSAVEIGPLGANAALIAAAVDHATAAR